tara:strand:+ start:1090 stop:1983 length:894 start_codon:yes stop_codon:yes gene_type:complete
MTETSGIVLFAYNTPEINYIKLAIIAARYAKRAMPSKPVCLITDNSTWEYVKQTSIGAQATDAFDQVVLTDGNFKHNKRVHYDSPYTNFVTDFKNTNKHKVIDYTPYDRTLLIDIDYIMQNNQLEYCFDSDNSVLMFHEAEDLLGTPPAQPQQFLHEAGIPMIWSTVMYFDRNSDVAKTFFDLWAHIADNYDFYRFLYGFPAGMYRTDFCVSIAQHIMNGMGPGDSIGAFPSTLINMSQRDDIVKINTADDWVYLVNDVIEHWENSLARITRENVHVMNKRSLDRNYDAIMEKLDNE